jgi:hypothetical protein
METIGTTASAAPIFIKLTPLVIDWALLPDRPSGAGVIKTCRLVEKFPLIRTAEHFVGAC